MGFEETIEGFEERFAEMTNLLCVVIGGVLMLFALVSLMDYTYKSMMYSMLATAFLLFPLAASLVFKKEAYVQSPPPIIRKKK